MTQEERNSLLERKKELLALIEEKSNRRDELSAIEQAIKLAMNSTYGAYINSGFAMSCSMVGKSVTGMGRTVINFVEKKHVHYWLEEWHKDKELHEKLGIVNEVKPISKDTTITIYGDTDSVDGKTKIYVNDNLINIEDYYEFCNQNFNNKIVLENEKIIIEPKNQDFTLSYDSNNKKIDKFKIKHVIKHENNKKIFKIKLKSGKEVICTEDHNLMVFRDGNIYNIKPNEILPTDKFLIYDKS